MHSKDRIGYVLDHMDHRIVKRQPRRTNYLLVIAIAITAVVIIKNLFRR